MPKKSYLTTKQQIDLLRSKKLIINNEELAKTSLESIGYYRIVNGYRAPFVHYENSKRLYDEGVTFEYLLNLYEFDKELRAIVFEAASIVEINFKSYVSNQVSKKYGTKEKDYLKPDNFKDDDLVKGDCSFSHIKKIVKDTIKQQYAKRDPIIVWYKEKYKHFPFWVVVNYLSMGSMCIIYEKMHQVDQIEVAKEYNLPFDYILEYMKHINSIRNICAHNNILYGYKRLKPLPHSISKVDKIYQKLKINKNANTNVYNIGTIDFLGTLIVFKLLLKEQDYNTLILKINVLINEFKEKVALKYFDKIMNIMGLTINYQDM